MFDEDRMATRLNHKQYEETGLEAKRSKDGVKAVFHLSDFHRYIGM